MIIQYSKYSLEFEKSKSKKRLSTIIFNYFDIYSQFYTKLYQLAIN